MDQSEVLEVTTEENRMYEHLKELASSANTRIIRPYWRYEPRAKRLYPRQTVEKAKGNFRGYIKHLIDLGILVRISEGRYFLRDVPLQVHAGKRRGNGRSKGGTFTVKRIAAAPAHVRIQLLTEEINKQASEIREKQSQLCQLTDLLQAIAGEL